MGWLGGLLGGLASGVLGIFGSGQRQGSAQSFASLENDKHYERAKEMATTSWDREQEGASTAYQRSQEAAETQWDKSEEAANTAWSREKDMAEATWGRSQKAAADAWQRSKQAATTQFSREEKSAMDSYKRSIDAYKNRYQMTVNDMAKAGLNPILASSGGFNVGSGVQSTPARAQMASSAMAVAPRGSAPMASGGLASAPMANAKMASPNTAQGFMHQFPDISQSAKNVADIIKISSETERTNQETKKLFEDTKLSSARAKNEIYKIQETRAKTGLAKAQEKLSIQKMFNAEQTFFKTAKEIDSLMKTMVNIDLTAKEKRKNLSILETKFQIMEEQRRQLTFHNEKLQQLAKAYEGKLGPTLGYIKAITDALGINFGMIVGGLKR